MSMQADVREARCQQGTSNKFYRAYVMYDEENGQYRVLFNYGRIGANGAFQAQNASSRDDAERAATAKLNSKVNKAYSWYPPGERHLDVVPEDLLEKAVVDRSDNDRSRQAERVKVDVHARFASDADTLIRMVSGPGGLTGEAVILRGSLQDQFDDLRKRLIEAEGQMELINDVIAMQESAA